MAKYIIYSSGGVAKAEGCPTYTGTYMDAGVLSFREIASPTPIDWQIGDYVVYDRTGYTYKLYQIPQVKRQAKSWRYGGAMVYQDVQFYDDSYMLKICRFRDIVPGDNRIHFSTQPSISVFDDVAGIAERLQACLTEDYGNWVVRCATASDGASSDLITLMAEEKEFVISDASIRDCLTKVYELWPEVGYIYRIENGVNTIIIGGAGLSSGQELYAYGKGNGLLSLTRTLANADEYANRLYVYGSARNMLSRWYSTNYPNIKYAESVDIQHLMLPVADWGTTDGKYDPSKAYIQATSDTILRAKVAYFDGSGDYSEIYPTIRGITSDELRAEIPSGTTYRPSTSIYPDHTRMDKIRSVASTFDNGLPGDASGKSYIEEDSRTITVLSGTSTVYEGTTYQLVAQYQDYFIPDNEGVFAISVNLSLNGSINLSGITGATMDFSIKHPSYQGQTIVDKSIELTKTADGVYSISGGVFSVPKALVSTASYVVTISFYITCDSGATRTCSFDYDGTLSIQLRQYRAKTFTVTIPQIGFNIEEQAALGDGKTIYMASGMCVGRSFTIKSATYLSGSDSWQLEIIRGNDESLSQWFPNSSYPVAANDEFILLDIAMPALYVGIAEKRLKAAALELYSYLSTRVWQYTPEIDAKFMVENSRTITPGEYIVLSDVELNMDSGSLVYFKEHSDVYYLTHQNQKILLNEGGYSAPVMVDSVTINEGEYEIPTYKVTLRERKKKTYTTYDAPSTSSMSSVESANEGASVQSSGGSNYFEPDSDNTGGVKLKDAYPTLFAETMIADKFFLGGQYTPSGGTATDSILEWDSQYNAWHLVGNFYADGWVSAGGVSTSSSGSGITETQMWNLLATADPTHKISPYHLNYDNSTLGVNPYGQLYVIGGGGSSYSSGTVALLNAGTSTTDYVWSPSVLASWLSGKGYATTQALGSYVLKTGDSMSGSLVMDNGISVAGRNIADTADIPLIKVNSSNIAEFGNSSYSSYYKGFSSVFQTGGSSNYGMFLNQYGGLTVGSPENLALNAYKLFVNGPAFFQGAATISGTAYIDGAATLANTVKLSTSSNKVYVGTSHIPTTTTDFLEQYLEWDDTNSAWHLVGNFYADGFISSGGVSDTAIFATLTRDQEFTGENTFSGATTFGANVTVGTGKTLTAPILSTTYINPVGSVLYLASTGAVSVGGTAYSSSYKLYVTGSAYATGSFVSASDRRLKDNIVTLDGQAAIDTIMALKPSTWVWNDNNPGVSGRKGAGFIAQDVLDYLPYAVHGDDYLALNYNTFHAFEVSALQSHEQRIKAIEEHLMKEDRK